jgi:putative aldouronate transport system permease protein
MTGPILKNNRQVDLNRKLKQVKANYQLYLMLLLPVIWLIIFRYVPMAGVQIAFKNFKSTLGIFGSEWVGLKNFKRFFTNYQFWNVVKNTIGISLYQLAVGFPFPIILALALNSTSHVHFKKAVQMITYMPHFISVVVIVGMIIQFTSPKLGIINKLIVACGGTAIDFMSRPELFSSIYVWSGIWQTCGWGTIIYLAALAGVDTELHEAAMIDGATRFQRVLNVDLPLIVPTMVTMLILRMGSIMNIGFEKVFLMQNSLNRDASEVISTMVYKVGLASSFPDFSYATAIGLCNSVINFALVILVNRISRKMSGTGLW